MKYAIMPIALAFLALASCATTGSPPIETRAQEVVITRTEKAITPDQVNAVTPPAPLGARPADARSALSIALAKVCEYVGFSSKVDLLAQQSAGMTPVQRVIEPICNRSPK